MSLRDTREKQGLWVVFLGSDGSGKSSVIDAIQTQLAPLFSQTTSFHLRPSLKGLAPQKQSHAVTQPHLKAPRSGLMSLIKLFYLIADYSLGYIFKIKPLLKQSAFIIFDRYYYDLEVDPLRFRYGASLKAARFFERWIPHPDLVILLDAPAEVLYKRKPELPVEELQRQRIAYHALLRRLDRSAVIDASLPLSTVVDQTRQAIETLFHTKCAQSNLHDFVENVTSKVFPPESTLTDSNTVPSLNRYWVIPAAKGYPRWIVPQQAKLGQNVLLQWQPSIHLKWRILFWLYRMRLIGIFPGVKSIGINIPQQSWAHLGWHHDTPLIPVIYIGTPSAISRLVVSLTDSETGTVKLVSKIPSAPLSHHGILKEYAILSALDKQKPGVAPQALFLDPENHIVSQAPIIGAPAEEHLTLAHIQWLIHLKIEGETTTLSEQIDMLMERIHQCDALGQEKIEVLSNIAGSLKQTIPLQAVYVHGDFSPWNLIWTGEQQLGAFDWEHAKLKGLPLYDLLHYEFIRCFVLNQNTDILPQLKENPLLQHYIKALEIDLEMLKPIFLFYLLDYWFQRIEDNNFTVANAYYEKILAVYREGLS